MYVKLKTSVLRQSVLLTFIVVGVLEAHKQLQLKAKKMGHILWKSALLKVSSICSTYGTKHSPKYATTNWFR